MPGTVTVDTRPFRRKHGYEPMGCRLWTFKYAGLKLYFTMRGKYEVCLGEAIKAAKAKGVTAISVSSIIYGQDEE